MQRIEIIGTIGKEAEVKDLNNNHVINFSVAVNERVKDEEKTIWFDVAKFGNQTGVAPYLKKGTKVFVSGKVNNRAWLNQSGEAQVSNGIVAFEVELLSKSESNGSASGNTSLGYSSNTSFDEDPPF